VNEKNVKGRKSNTQFYTVSVRTFVVPFYYGSGTGINYGSVPLRQKVTASTVPVPQHCCHPSIKSRIPEDKPENERRPP
jgi:hypothetical protein